MTLPISSEELNQLKSIVAAQQGITLESLFNTGINRDLVFYTIAHGFIYVDIHTQSLTEPQKVKVYTDEATAKAHLNFYAVKKTVLTPSIINLEAGGQILIEDIGWRILSAGHENIKLINEEGTNCIDMDRDLLARLTLEGKVKGVSKLVENDEARLKLSTASSNDLDEANRRYSIIKPYLEGEPKKNLPINKRTLDNWLAQFRAAEIKYQDGFIGLIPRTSEKGNTASKIPEQTIIVIDEVITEEYETNKQRNILNIHAELVKRCDELGLHKPSYNTLKARIKKRDKQEQTYKRKGKRAAYEYEPFFWELEYSTPRHGSRPFEICHIDHTTADVELVSSDNGKSLGRPTLTCMIDAFTRRILVVYLSFYKPSAISCMMAIRLCVKRYGRLPQILVTDGGKEFQSVHFETLLSRYGVTKKTRPPAKSRFGNLIERMFCTINTQFFFNLLGNTQIMKNVRQFTKSNNPKSLAVWTLPDLYESLSHYVFEVYDTIEHKTLGQSPRECFENALALTGARTHKLIPFDRAFLIDTMPGSKRGFVKVNFTRGIQVNGIRYWSDAFRNPTVENTKVEVKFDPMDVGIAYAFVNGNWVECISDYYSELKGKSRGELYMISEQLRKKISNSNKISEITLRKIAENARENAASEQILLKRLKDEENKKINSKIDGNHLQPCLLAKTPTISDNSAQDSAEEILEVYNDY